MKLAHLVICGMLASPFAIKNAPKDPPATARIGSPGEAGTPLVVSGTVYAADGQTPAGGVMVYAYQTDAQGLYAPDGGVEKPRLHGWARTDASGHYQFATIRPAPYPRRSIPAHIHFNAWGGGYPWQWLEELQFADDPHMTAALREKSAALGRFANVCAPEHGSDGTLRCTLDLKLQTTSNFK